MTEVSTARAEQPAQAWCPSGLADAPESIVLGVRSGDSGELAYLAEPVPAAEVLGDIPEGVEPTRILRFASHCVSSCANNVNGDCSLVDRVVTAAPVQLLTAVPRCHLRAKCKWWHQTGVTACYRCPAVATANHVDDELATLVADPSTTPEQLQAWVAESEK
jgi:hypothetical protein